MKSSCNPKVHLVADGGAYMTVGADFSGSGPKLSSRSRAWLGRLGAVGDLLGPRNKELGNNFVVIQFTFSVFMPYWQFIRSL